MRLEDGTILAHYFKTVEPTDSSTGRFDNLALRFGEIIDIVYPGDPRSYSKSVEYIVSVNQRDMGGLVANVIYTHCTVSTLFGGVADKSTYTLRKADSTIDTLSNGSKVLLACINGETNYGVILGGLRDEQLDTSEKDIGHNSFFEFNGANITIDKDGQYKLMIKGATKADGSPATGVSLDITGQSISLLKDGSIKLATHNDSQFLVFDNTLKKVSLVANTELDLTSNGNIIVKSTGVKVGIASDAWMKGTTYRKAEASMHKTLSQQLGIAVTALNAASVAIKGLTPPPIAATVAIAVQEAASALSLAQGSIDQFEAKSSSFLSIKNLSD